MLIKTHRINTGKRGGAVEAIEILPAGYEALGLKPPEQQIKGGYIHRWWCHQIAEWLKRQGQKPIFEKLLGSKACDVAFENVNNATWVAYETQLSNSIRTDLLKDLIIKDIAAGFQKITICVETSNDVDKVKNVISGIGNDLYLNEEAKNVHEKVAVNLLREFL
jgi:hypothetical protein